MVFLPVGPLTKRGLLKLSGHTDNATNAQAVVKLMTTSFPLCAVLCELSVQCRRRNVSLELGWIPRDQNCEADQLSNGDSGGFDPLKRVSVDPSGLQFVVLPELMKHGMTLFEDIAKAKTATSNEDLPGLSPKKKARSARNPKRAPETRLRATEPW